MAFLHVLHLTLLIITIIIISSTTSSTLPPISKSLNDTSSSPTAYEVLEGYGFPAGILPKGALGYELDNSTGRFSAHLNGSCSFGIEGYELNYKSTITGKIADHKLSGLSGIQVKVLFFWMSIATVERAGDELQFSVGVASADFAAGNFEESPTCGCGFDCTVSSC